jgi:fucose 4-O-acetylase-like acetyltransferase
MCWFPLFPWGAWSLLGVVVGHLWLRHGRDQQGQRRCFAGGLLLGVLFIATVVTIRAINPEIIRYPSDVVQQMGPGSFFFRLGIIGIASFLGWLHTRNDKGGFSIIRQLGQTSLLIYWVHVEICYGFGARPIQKQLSFGGTTLAFLILLAAMLGLSILRTRYSDRVLRWIRQRRPPRSPSTSTSSPS